MAVDSKAKRFGMMAFGRGPHLPHPDGTIAAFDRATLLRLYGGIGLSTASVPLALAPTGPIRRIAGTEGTVGRVRSTDSVIRRVPTAGPTPWDLMLLSDWEDMTWDEIEAITFEVLLGRYTVKRVG